MRVYFTLSNRTMIKDIVMNFHMQLSYTTGLVGNVIIYLNHTGENNCYGCNAVTLHSTKLNIFV